jgi:hypothetical protein
MQTLPSQLLQKIRKMQLQLVQQMAGRIANQSRLHA